MYSNFCILQVFVAIASCMAVFRAVRYANAARCVPDPNAEPFDLDNNLNATVNANLETLYRHSHQVFKRLDLNGNGLIKLPHEISQARWAQIG